jgi:hypothetical protein
MSRFERNRAYSFRTSLSRGERRGSWLYGDEEEFSCDGGAASGVVLPSRSSMSRGILL